MLGIEAGEGVGIGAFVARYSDMAGSWGTTVLMSLSSLGWGAGGCRHQLVSGAHHYLLHAARLGRHRGSTRLPSTVSPARDRLPTRG